MQIMQIIGSYVCMYVILARWCHTDFNFRLSLIQTYRKTLTQIYSGISAQHIYIFFHLAVLPLILNFTHHDGLPS